MILETLGNSGLIWLTSRVKKSFSCTFCPWWQAVYWTFYIHFLFAFFSSWVSRYLLIMPAVPGCAEMLIFQGRVKLALFQAFSVQCCAGFGSWTGAHQHYCCLPTAFFGNCSSPCSWRCLKPCVGAICKEWWQVEVLPSASHHCLVVSFPMKAQRGESLIWWEGENGE